MKLFATDYDGTYLKHTKLGRKQLKKNIEATQKWRANGNIFAFATGRSLGLMKIEQRFKKLECDYVVGLNGAIVATSKGEVIYKKVIETHIAREIVALIERSQIHHVLVTDGFNGYLSTDTNMLSPEFYLYKGLRWLFKMFNQTVEEALNADVVQIAVKMDDEKSARDFAIQINELYGDAVVAYSNLVHVDICAKNISKASGIEVIRARHEIEMKHVYCIGDSFNDVPMIETYEGYAMIEADPEIKRKASAVFETVAMALAKSE